MANDSKKIKLEERVEVIMTGEGGFYAANTKAKVHPLLAEKLIKAGKAKKA
jgi:hypothetical protein